MSIRSIGVLEERGASLIDSLRDTLNQLAAQRAPIAVPDLAHLADAYIEDLRFRRRKPSYWRKAETRLKRLMAFAPTGAAADVRRFRSSLLDLGTSKETANKYVDALRRCLDWGVDQSIISGHELIKVERLDIADAERVKRRRSLTDGEVLRFLDVSEKEDRGRDFPQTTLWRSLIEIGLRWSEAAKAEADDLRNDALLIRAKNTKNGKARWFPLSHQPALIVDLRRALPFRTPRGERLPIDSHNALRTLYRMLGKAGIERHDPDGRSIDIHALRWTAVTRMLRRGVPMETAAALIGHADVELLRKGVYADIGLEDHREVLLKAWGGTATKSPAQGPPRPT